ncbi:uncharacterized protein LOC135397238 isoform X2 [Ornithodoros turicata]
MSSMSGMSEVSGMSGISGTDATGAGGDEERSEEHGSDSKNGGSDDNDYPVSYGGGGSSSPPSIPAEPASPPSTTTTTTTTTTTIIPNYFLMCTVGLRFFDTKEYKTVGCTYFVFDSVIPTDIGLMGSEDQRAWKVFKSLSWAPNPLFGISFPGKYAADLTTALSNTALDDLKQLFVKGYRAFGVLNCKGDASFLHGTAGKNIGDLFDKIFNSMTQVQRDAGPVIFFVGLQLSAGSTSQSAALMQDAKAISHLKMLILQSHIAPQPPLTASECFIYPSSSWTQTPIKDNIYSSVQRASSMLSDAPNSGMSFAISFSMALSIYVLSSEASSNTKMKDSCSASGVSSPDEYCSVNVANVSTQTDNAEHIVWTYIRHTRYVYSYTPDANVIELYNAAKASVQSSKRFGILVADAQLDYTRSCSCGKLCRLQAIATFLDNLRKAGL